MPVFGPIQGFWPLLRGMGALDPAEIPPVVARLALPESADFDGDRVLTTGELDAYVNRTLPPLSLQFPRWVVAARQADGVPIAYA